MAGKLTWQDFFLYYKDKVDMETPITDAYVMDENDYQQKNDGYIDYAKKCDLISDSSKAERNKLKQSWHFFVSYLYIYKVNSQTIPAQLSETKNQRDQISIAIQSIEKNESALNRSKPCFLPCVELTLWMAEVSGVLKDIKAEELQEMLELIKQLNKKDICARCIWKMVNDEVFHSEGYIWDAICAKVAETK